MELVPKESEFVRVAVQDSGDDYDIDDNDNKKLRKPKKFIWKKQKTMRDFRSHTEKHIEKFWT